MFHYTILVEDFAIIANSKDGLKFDLTVADNFNGASCKAKDIPAVHINCFIFAATCPLELKADLAILKFANKVQEKLEIKVLP